MRFRTPDKTVRGLGSAKEGVAHWWAQRMTALALVPLCLWFVASLACVAGAGRDAFAEWLAAPFNAVAMLLLLGAGLYHAVLGLQVVIEDYVGREGPRTAAVVLTRGLGWLLGAASLFSVLKVALGG